MTTAPISSVQGFDLAVSIEGVNDLSIETAILFLKLQNDIAIEAQAHLDFSNIELKVQPIRPGSVIFSYLIDLYADNSELFNDIATELGKVLFREAVKGVLKLMFKNKGRQPEITRIENNYAYIRNTDGNEYVVPLQSVQIYKDQTVQKGANKFFRSVSETRNFTEIKYLDSTETFSANRNEVSEYNYQNPVVQSRIHEDEVSLTIIRMSFEPHFKWLFSRNNSRLLAKISDDIFWAQVNDGEIFSKGDSLFVELSIYKEFDEELGTWVEKSFEVKKVLRHLRAPQQLDLGIE